MLRFGMGVVCFYQRAHCYVWWHYNVAVGPLHKVEAHNCCSFSPELLCCFLFLFVCVFSEITLMLHLPFSGKAFKTPSLSQPLDSQQLPPHTHPYYPLSVSIYFFTDRFWQNVLESPGWPSPSDNADFGSTPLFPHLHQRAIYSQCSLLSW